MDDAMQNFDLESLGPFWMFVVCLFVRLFVWLVGEFSENAKLSHRHVATSLTSGLCVALLIPIARYIIKDENDIAAAASVVAAVIGAYVGSIHYQRTKS